MRIRPASIDDAESVAGIQVRGWKWAYRGLMPTDYLDALSVEGRLPGWRSAIEEFRDERRILVAEEESSVVGFAALGPTRDEDARRAGGEVYAIYVDPDRTGRGIGRELLSAVQAELTSIGHHAATLWVIDGNERAQRFYRAAGWRTDGETKVDMRWGFALREIRYRVDL